MNLFTNGDLYDDDSYASCANWKLEKKPGTDPKKIEFNIGSPGTDLKEIEFNINVNDNAINDLNNKEAVHLNDGLAVKTILTLKTGESNTNRLTNTIVFLLLLKTNYNQAIN